ncbi:hypothetical protein K4039_17455 [Lyngbya sp. CCAP 1446/10]|uniref:hypothetical protein n=1 Tax=Lyngbya sp. CCAP 1446/10 TaxID=439293 RepID=UPI00223830E8|nr:hypothetical protein [Lyngbya sp. CCAP 1446/10]MCW6051829.1 hypothetical protein [Lyngbya sp. CCAP 1446/10]
MLAELISARRILKAQLLDFLGLPDNCQDQTDRIVSTIVSVLEANAAEQERFWETFKSELAVDPVELEAMLKCSAAERQQWIEQGKLPILEYRSFRKSGIHLEYPVHDRRIILNLTPTDIDNWRKEPKGLIQNNLPKADPINTENSAQNEQSRLAFSAAWEKIIADWKEQGSAEISATFQLAYWTVWASRWAKEHQLNSFKAIKSNEIYDETRQQEWYERKNQAVKSLIEMPYAMLYFYRPPGADKLYLELCEDHQDMMKDDYYWDKWEFFNQNRKQVNRCRECVYSETKDYYSLYYLEIKSDKFPDFSFSFHTPYTIGRKFLPHPETLPYVDHVEQDGIFRFGRPLLEQEKVIHTEKDVLLKFEAALAEAKKFI